VALLSLALLSGVGATWGCIELGELVRQQAAEWGTQVLEDTSGHDQQGDAEDDDDDGGDPRSLADGWEAVSTAYDLQTVVAALSRVPQLATAHGGARQLRAELSRPYRFYLPAVFKHRRARGGGGGVDGTGGGGGGGGSARSPTMTPASSGSLLRLGSDGLMGERLPPPPMEQLLRCARQSAADALPAPAAAVKPPFGEMAARCSQGQTAQAASAEFAHQLVSRLARAPLVH
jgi:hypothetical protein